MVAFVTIASGTSNAGRVRSDGTTSTRFDFALSASIPRLGVTRIEGQLRRRSSRARARGREDMPSTLAMYAPRRRLRGGEVRVGFASSQGIVSAVNEDCGFE